MSSGKQQQQFVFLCCILLLQLANSQPVDFQAHYCNYDYTGTYTDGSRYKRNLDALPSLLTGSERRFYNLTIGRGNPESVSVIGLCRGDVETDICHSCLLDANDKLRDICPNQKQSILWYDECMLRYTDRSIFHTVNTVPNAYTYNPTTVSSAATTQFNQAVRKLLDRLTSQASGDSSVGKFATGNLPSGPPGNSITIYGLAECTPDLSREQCSRCLSGTASVLPECCDGRIGGRVLRPSCNFRYEMGQFYN